MIDPKKQYRTRDGREVRVFMTDGGDWQYPVIAAYKDHAGRWWPLHLTKDGRISPHLSNHNGLDLIEVRPRIQREVWVNVYAGHEHVYSCKIDAENGRARHCIACVKLTIDCEEGEGL